MQLQIQEDFQITIPKKLPSKNVILMSRDLEIIEFIIAMKFVSVTDLFHRFFKVTLSEREARNDLWARKRLLQLEQGKFIRSQRVYSEKEIYYSGTLKGYYAVSGLYPEKFIVKPIGGLDFRTFSHDKLVLKSRLAMEPEVRAWISDRQLRCFPELAGGLTGNYVPDAIYTNLAGEKIAFELEISVKAKERYREKIRKYLSLFRGQSMSKPFSRVHYVCAKESVLKLIEQETKMYPELFKTELLANFLPTILTK